MSSSNVIFIHNFFHLTTEEGREQGTKDCPLVYEWHERKYWGAAHGTCGLFERFLVSLKAGILFVLLGLYKEFICASEGWVSDIKATIEYLLQRFLEGAPLNASLSPVVRTFRKFPEQGRWQHRIDSVVPRSPCLSFSVISRVRHLA